ncbi:MAG: sulfurtransferase TusA family protein, partial [Caldimicrobium sp.]
MIREIDVRGLPCPKPVIKTKEALEESSVGEKIKVLINSKVSLQNIQKFLSAHGHKLLSIIENGEEFSLIIEKGENLSAEGYSITCAPQEEKKKLLLIVASDHIGDEPEL